MRIELFMCCRESMNLYGMQKTTFQGSRNAFINLWEDYVVLSMIIKWMICWFLGLFVRIVIMKLQNKMWFTSKAIEKIFLLENYLNFGLFVVHMVSFRSKTLDTSLEEILSYVTNHFATLCNWILFTIKLIMLATTKFTLHIFQAI